MPGKPTKFVPPSALTPAQVVELRQLRMDGYSSQFIGERFGIDPRNVKAISDGELRRDVMVNVPRWRPLCMTTDEHQLWLTEIGSNFTTTTPRPCDDCPVAFAADMRILGLCNGTPRGIQEDEEAAA